MNKKKMLQYHREKREREKKLGNEVAALAVVSPLVFQPGSVTRHAANFLAVVIGDGVRDRVGGRIDTEPANAIKELLLFLHSGNKPH